MRELLTVFFILLSTASFAEENDLELTLFGSFLHAKKVPNALFFFSDIQKNDSFELRRALRTYEIDTVVLASRGGSVWEGLNMAGIIFDKKMTTYVPKLSEEKGCYSACAFMFFAGQTRLTEGELGVHQVGAYNEDLDNQKRKLGETQQDTQFTTSEVIGFLNEFNTPPWVYERMFRSREIYLFTQAEKKLLNVGAIGALQKKSIDEYLLQLDAKLREVAEKKVKAKTAHGLDVSNIELVRAFQVSLNDAKCSAGVADGVWGRRTNAAATRFAEANKLVYSGPRSISQPFIDLLTSENKKRCAALKKTVSPTKPVKKGSVNTKISRPNKLHLHWRFECKGGVGAKSVPIFAKVASYNSSNGKAVFIITDRDGFKGRNTFIISNGQITMFGQRTSMRNNFTKFVFENVKDCPKGFIGQALN